MKQIYNEGRVVGFSAYELYVRQQLSQNPEASIPTEREWLSNTIGFGNSMLLKVPSGTTAGYHDFELPQKSNLCACSEIIASPFIGDAIFDETGLWGKKVISYGQLIPNNTTMSPSTPGQSSDVPSSVTAHTFPEHKFVSTCAEYSNIVDGIAFQPGTWTDYNIDGVAKSFEPDVSKPGVIRLWFKTDTKDDLLVLLHGFMNKTVISGTTGFESCMDTANPENGDYLGPMSYPWAVRISFMMTGAVDGVINRNVYERSIPADSDSILIQTKSAIDFETCDPKTYYNEKNMMSSAVSMDVKQCAVSQVANIVAYQAADDYPPAIYGAKITDKGEQFIYPLDVVAPGSVKVFTDEDLAKQYPKDIKNVYGMLKDKNNHIFLFDSEGHKIGVSSSVEISQPEDDVYIGTISTGNDSVYMIPLQSEVNGEQFSLDGSAGMVGLETLSWRDLLKALSTNQSIELVAKELKKFRELNLKTILENGKVNDLEINENYILFNDTRLYISNSEPKGDIPVGSIGIGW